MGLESKFKIFFFFFFFLLWGGAGKGEGGARVS